MERQFGGLAYKRNRKDIRCKLRGFKGYHYLSSIYPPFHPSIIYLPIYLCLFFLKELVDSKWKVMNLQSLMIFDNCWVPLRGAMEGIQTPSWFREFKLKVQPELSRFSDFSSA